MNDNNFFKMPKEQLVRNYIETVKKLQDVYDTIKTGKVYKQEQFKELYKPIIDPLNKLTDEIDSISTKNVQNLPKILPKQTRSQEIQPMLEMESFEKIGKTARKYLSNYASKNIKTDKIFGIRFENGKPYIGNQSISFDDDDILFEDGKKFTGTTGLWELLTLENPENFQDLDKENYVEILQKTSSYKHNNDPAAKNVKSSVGFKYKNIVKPLLLEKGFVRPRLVSTPSSSDQESTGSGLHKLKTYDLLKELVAVYRNIQNGNMRPESIKETIDKIKLTPLSVSYPNKISYWDTLDELFQKLTILYGEIEAGNSKPELMNEAIRIMQELKEL